MEQSGVDMSDRVDKSPFSHRFMSEGRRSFQGQAFDGTNHQSPHRPEADQKLMQYITEGAHDRRESE